MDWRDWEVFETREEWDTSAVVESLKTDFTLRTGKLSSRQVYHCRFARKKGFNCGVKVKLTFSEIDDTVSVQGLGEHNHELQVKEEQEEVVMTIEVASVIDGRGSRTLAVGLSNLPSRH